MKSKSKCVCSKRTNVSKRIAWGKEGEKMNIGVIDKIYNYLSGQVDYVGLMETEAARKKVKAYLMCNILSTEAHKQWVGLEGGISEFGMENERQGFIYGFRYAVELLVRGENVCKRGHFPIISLALPQKHHCQTIIIIHSCLDYYYQYVIWKIKDFNRDSGANASLNFQ